MVVDTGGQTMPLIEGCSIESMAYIKNEHAHAKTEGMQGV